MGGTDVQLGASGCSDADIKGVNFVWNGSAKSVSAIECSALGTAANAAVAFTFNVVNIAFENGDTQTLDIETSVSLKTLTSGYHVCWKSGSTLTPITECGLAGTSTDIGKTGCGAANTKLF